ncbi:MAG TPA: O-antigen ligase family protein [Bacteroidales bacterium]|nr:O-antigen ligase family protein [Bacteroidales bacterium]HCI56298.1 hypothetical protein [Bacteroidales bacterium]HOU95079.1 O-antigen ligase family protein [Bacteroidales bacterium]HQG36431.1 O-antigen ligase family protein [Bacteroidales bacterium]HQG53663.1 O-antigen ligase family protein [Bacteroidales bacterium]
MISPDSGQINKSVDNPYRKYLNVISLVFLSAALFLISFKRSWSLYPIGALIATGFLWWILEFKSIFKAFINRWYLVLPPVIFFLMQFVSVIIGSGSLKLIETRLMFLLMPLFIFPFFYKQLPNLYNRIIIFSFVSGIAIISLYLFARALADLIPMVKQLGIEEVKKSQSHRLFYSYLSIFEHPTYLSMKALWAMVLILIMRPVKKASKILIPVLFIIFSSLIFFLGSRAGLLAWFIVILTLITGLLMRIKKNRLAIFIATAFILISFLFAVTRISKVNRFIKSTISSLENIETEWKNLDVRTRVWYSAFQLIKEKPLTGYGMAKVEDKLDEEYLKNGFTTEAELHYNAHNQYIETQITLGIAGLFVLLWMLFTPVIHKKQIKFPRLAVYFVLIVVINLFFESMFNRQWGIMFFMIFYCFLTFQPATEQKDYFLKDHQMNIPEN